MTPKERTKWLEAKGKPYPKTDYIRYERIKKQIREGILVSREDFLFVKSIDQRKNARRGVNKNWPKLLPVVYSGFNTT